ncbi:hypothetical protein PASE110613_09315 [Paenibacillus sediminis]|uniref:YqaJ viral recombinase domain-containing protein n=1 Tax=Paenibacillus sediminis TaxID=664909 RepID=A0ABS4H6I9_9BACL|nr:hypothetical protein [Paenibacillus sediminis]MBP1938153.1 hypothetical protein [Paenibacillus sediminis]
MYDDALDAQIHRWYFDYLTDNTRKVWPARGIPYFSPSAANADARGLYEKMRGAKKEQTERPAHQGRWTRIGTAIGDTIQRDILFAEAHAKSPNFRFERNDRGEPMFEDFAKINTVIEHNGKVFSLFGTCDGIMRYVSEDGEVLRVGLEVKSKQTTFSMTSAYSTRNGPKEDHVKQCVCYSKMYCVDYYVILYVNASKKSWNMTADEFEKSPDIAAFGVYITDEMRDEVLDHFAGIVDAAETGNPPKLDLDKWLFNDFKRAIALSLSDDELVAIQREVTALQRSGLPDWKKRGPAEALEFILAVRSEDQAKEAA